MDIRQPIHSEHAKTLDTTGLRRHFLVEQLFVPEQATLTYSQIDRIIVGGIHPVRQTVRFAAELGKHTGTDFFLQRRALRQFGDEAIRSNLALTLYRQRFGPLELVDAAQAPVRRGVDQYAA